MKYIVASLPKETAAVLALSCELPPENADEIQRQDFADFHELARECGAIGFYLDSVRMRNGK